MNWYERHTTPKRSQPFFPRIGASEGKTLGLAATSRKM